MFQKKRCITKKIFKIAKHRMINKTKKAKKYFKMELQDNPTKFLTIDELYNQPCNSKNDILKYIKTFSFNKSKYHKKYLPRIQELKQIRKQCIQYLGKKNIVKNKKLIHKYHTK